MKPLSKSVTMKSQIRAFNTNNKLHDQSQLIFGWFENANASQITDNEMGCSESDAYPDWSKHFVHCICHNKCACACCHLGL